MPLFPTGLIRAAITGLLLLTLAAPASATPAPQFPQIEELEARIEALEAQRTREGDGVSDALLNDLRDLEVELENLRVSIQIAVLIADVIRPQEGESVDIARVLGCMKGVAAQGISMTEATYGDVVLFCYRELAPAPSAEPEPEPPAEPATGRTYANTNAFNRDELLRLFGAGRPGITVAAALVEIKVSDDGSEIYEGKLQIETRAPASGSCGIVQWDVHGTSVGSATARLASGAATLLVFNGYTEQRREGPGCIADELVPHRTSAGPRFEVIVDSPTQARLCALGTRCASQPLAILRAAVPS
jgi:hypothetical protein